MEFRQVSENSYLTGESILIILTTLLLNALEESYFKYMYIASKVKNLSKYICSAL